MTTNQLQQANKLLNELIHEAARQDAEFKLAKLKEHKANDAVGESWFLFHLKQLRDLLAA